MDEIEPTTMVGSNTTKHRCLKVVHDGRATLFLLRFCTCQVLAEKFEQLGGNVCCLFPTYSQQRILRQHLLCSISWSQTKVHVSANIAKMSLTAKGIKYIINSGYYKL
jgi:HrpA-like RNA helicase